MFAGRICAEICVKIPYWNKMFLLNLDSTNLFCLISNSKNSKNWNRLIDLVLSFSKQTKALTLMEL